MAEPVRVLIHVQHMLGTGHIVRAAAVGRALAAEGCAVTLAAGNVVPPTVNVSGLDVVALPRARAADASFRIVVGAEERPMDPAFEVERRAATLALYDTFRPDILLIETYPFGRRHFRFELDALIDTAHADPRRPLIASSIRDILVRKDDPAKEVAMAERARALCDVVLVHADPAMVRLDDSFPPAPDIADLLRYTGFVYPDVPAAATGSDGVGEVIVSVGGGAFGENVLATALRAQKTGVLADRRWRYLVGRGLPDTPFDRLRQAAPDNAIVERARADFPALLTRAFLSISQAGYNTVLDILRARIRAVLVPFGDGEETEQPQRAAALARRGRVVTVAETGMTPDILAHAVSEAAAMTPPDLAIGLDGARKSAEILLAEHRRLHPA